MARDTNEIEQAVRNVLSEVLSDVSDGVNSSDPASGSSSSSSGLKTRSSLSGSPKPPGGDNDKPDIPPEVLDALEDVCSDMSAEQGKALASLFEAIADQAEEGHDEPEEEDEGFGAKSASASASALELGSEEDARSEGERIASKGPRGALSVIIRLLKKSGPLLRAAVRAAKKGHRAFMKWVNDLSNFNPV